MKISVNDVVIFELSETQKQVLKHDIHADEFESDMKRRLNWVLMHKYENSFAHLKDEWDSKLATNGVKMIPTNQDAYAQLVFSQPGYKDRKARDLVEGK